MNEATVSHSCTRDASWIRPPFSECHSTDASWIRMRFQGQLIQNSISEIPVDWECLSRDTSWLGMPFQGYQLIQNGIPGYQLIQNVIPRIPVDSESYSRDTSWFRLLFQEFQIFYFYLFIKIGVNSTVSIYLAAGLWIRIRMDPQSFSLLDPENARKLVIIGFYYIFYSQLDKLHIFCTLITFSYLTTPENSS